MVKALEESSFLKKKMLAKQLQTKQKNEKVDF